MTYFLDNTFPPQFAESLRPFGHDLRHLLHVPEFPNKGATKDEEWMPFVGERGWVTLTSDRRIASTQRQREILISSRLTTFFFPKGYSNHGLWTQFTMFVRAWEQITANAERARPGDCFDVQESGRVNIMPLKR